MEELTLLAKDWPGTNGGELITNVRLIESLKNDPGLGQANNGFLELRFVLNSQDNDRRMFGVRRNQAAASHFNGCMSALNDLLWKWKVFANENIAIGVILLLFAVVKLSETRHGLFLQLVIAMRLRVFVNDYYVVLAKVPTPETGGTRVGEDGRAMPCLVLSACIHETCLR
jgi:hypothetical protein